MANGIEAAEGDSIDTDTWEALLRDAPEEVIIEYTVESADMKGPFTKQIPYNLDEQRDLDRLNYRSASEQLAERYHMDEDFFDALNADKTLEAGSKIWVVNVRQDNEIGDIAKLEVAKSIKQLRAYAEDGMLVAAFPATVGSDERPAPSGTLTIEAVADEPTYTVKPSNDLKGVDASKAFETASHGCIRVTNWDARTLGRSVQSGMKVRFVEEPDSRWD